MQLPQGVRLRLGKGLQAVQTTRKHVQTINSGQDLLVHSVVTANLSHSITDTNASISPAVTPNKVPPSGGASPVGSSLLANCLSVLNNF